MQHPLVYFYGSYINEKVLAEVGIRIEEIKVVFLDDFDLIIAPRANLLRKVGARSYGIAARVPHALLDKLYSEHSQGILGQTYLPEAVLIETMDGETFPALTYICHEMVPGEVDNAYVERIAGPGETYGFPKSYISHIRSFAS